MLRGHSVARCQYNEKITEYSLLLQHLSIYYNDNHSLSDLYCPYVVLATYITPKIFAAKHTTISIVLLIIIYKPC